MPTIMLENMMKFVSKTELEHLHSCTCEYNETPLRSLLYSTKDSLVICLSYGACVFTISDSDQLIIPVGRAAKISQLEKKRRG